MLIKLGNRWVDPATIRCINDAGGYGDVRCRLRFKLHGDAQDCIGISADDAAAKVNAALENPLFFRSRNAAREH